MVNTPPTISWKFASGTRLRLIATAITLAALLYAGRNYLHELDRLRSVNWQGIAAIACVHVLTLFCEAWLLCYALRALRQPVRLREGFAISVVSRYSNLIIPKSGVGIAAAYLNSAKQVSLAKYGSFLMFNASILILTCGGASLGVLMIDWCVTGKVSWLILIGLSCLTLAGLVAVKTRWRLPQWYRGPGADLFNRMSRAWSQLGGSSVISTIAALHVMMIALRTLRLYCAFAALNIPVHPWGVVQASLLGDLVFLVSFTPTAIGLREAALVGVAATLGTSAGLVLSTAMLDRVVFSLTTIVLAQIVLATSLFKTWKSKLLGQPVGSTSEEPFGSSQSALQR